jgi:hypothetical protein
MPLEGSHSVAVGADELALGDLGEDRGPAAAEQAGAARYRPRVARDPLDELFAAPLGEFVAVRNRIAAGLRDAGDRDAAAEVKALRKPSVVVWALNQLARSERAGVRALLKAAEEMRRVQSGRRRGSVADAQQALSEATHRLARQGAELLAATGSPPSDAVVRRLDAALAAAAASPDAADLLRAGRLLEEPEAAGFGGIGEVVALPKRSAASRDRDRERREAGKEAARQGQLDAAKRELRKAKADAARLSREAERAQEHVVALERRVAKLER